MKLINHAAPLNKVDLPSSNLSSLTYEYRHDSLVRAVSGEDCYKTFGSLTYNSAFFYYFIVIKKRFQCHKNNCIHYDFVMCSIFDLYYEFFNASTKPLYCINLREWQLSWDRETVTESKKYSWNSSRYYLPKNYVSLLDICIVQCERYTNGVQWHILFVSFWIGQTVILFHVMP